LALRISAQVGLQRGCGGPDRGRDGLFEAGGSRDRVAQRLRPGREGLQVLHGPAFLGRTAGQAGPGQDEHHRSDRDDRPAGRHEDDDADDHGHRDPRGQLPEKLRPLGAVVRDGGPGAHAVQGEHEQEHAAADHRSAEQHQRVEDAGRHQPHQSLPS
jgi:hypothetical protein